MSKMRCIFIVTLVGLMIFFGCKSKSPTGPDGENDSITITSVTPNSGLTPGIVTSFVVNVEYELASVDSGELGVGFNSVEVGRYAMITSAKVLIGKGSGSHQFNVSVVTRDWGNAGDFKVYVILSENPHGTTWTPLAWDIRTLTFK
jgi:hypothetical protein